MVQARLIGRAWGALIAALPFFDYFLRPTFQDIGGLYAEQTNLHVVPIISVLATVVLLAAAALSFVAALWLGVDYRRQATMAALSMALTVFALLSGFTSGAPTMPVIITTLFIAFVMAINLGALDPWEGTLEGFCLTIVVLFPITLLFALTSHDYTFGRLGGHAGPNYWGLVAGVSLMMCILLRPVVLRLAVVMVCLATLYVSQSRTAELGVMAGAAAMTLVKLRSMPIQRSVFWAISGAILLLVVVMVFGQQIGDKVLLVNDSYRGAASNGSGRFFGWVETLHVIAEHPLFGVGLRQHEQYIHAVANAHNAYLAVCAEQGLIGLSLYVVIMIGGTIKAGIRSLRQPSALRLVIFGYLTFFITIGLFEQWSLSTGNPFSLIAFIMAAVSWRAERLKTATPPPIPPAPWAPSHPAG